jgi:hypothetical protein
VLFKETSNIPNVKKLCVYHQEGINIRRVDRSLKYGLGKAIKILGSEEELKN